MKTENKKLELKKSTIAHLNLKEIKGGAGAGWTRFHSCHTSQCIGCDRTLQP